MKVGLVRTVGTGTDDDPFRCPVGGLGINIGGFWLTDVDDPSVEQLADDESEALSAGSASRVGNRLGLTLGRRQSPKDMMAELLMEHPGKGWGLLTPSTARTQLEIWFGNQIIWRKAVSPVKNTQMLTETWPTPGTTITSGQDNAWTVAAGTANVVAGTPNVIRSNAAAAAVAFKIALDTTNHLITCTFDLAAEAANNRCEARTRFDGADTRYMTQLIRNTGGHLRRLVRVVTGSGTVLATDTTDPGASGTILCSADGSSIRGVGGSFDQTVTDTGIATGDLNVGFMMLPSATSPANTQLRGDAEMEDIVAAVFGGAYQQQYRQMVGLA